MAAAARLRSSGWIAQNPPRGVVQRRPRPGPPPPDSRCGAAASWRSEAARRHLDPGIRWTVDAFPDLARVLRSGLSFDAVLASTVWQQAHPTTRARAFRTLASILKPGGLLALTLRHGPSPDGRCMRPMTPGDVLARDHGFAVVRCERAADMQGRPEVLLWTRMALRLPDDGMGVLPLLGHVILNDPKTAIYNWIMEGQYLMELWRSMESNL